MDPRPIGVFDSGIGGLTVLRALLEALPGEEYVYLGDTARLPYGTKTAATVERYALQAAAELARRDVKCLVVACNTASSAALPSLRARHPHVPVIGVIEPGAAAAVAATRSRRVAVLATEATVRSGAYREAIQRIDPGVAVVSAAAGLFVALAEEGWLEGEVARLTASRYLDALSVGDPQGFDTLVLGCTHFPPFVPVLRALLPTSTTIVDSAATTAAVVAAELSRHELLRPAGREPAPPRLLATDGLERFARVGARFLGRAVAAGQLALVDLA